MADNEGRDRGFNYQQLQHVATWDAAELNASRQAFAELPTEDRRRAAEGMLDGVSTFGFPGMGGLLPLEGDAVAFLLENPRSEDAAGDGNAWRRERDPIRAASTLASRWGSEDPVAAGDWVDSLPEGESRLWAARNLARNWAEYDPEGAAGWVSELPAAEREAAEAAMAEGGR